MRPLDPVATTVVSRVELDPIAADQQFAKLTAEELVVELKRRRGHATTSFYAMGLVLRELARPERFRVELGFETFEDLLEQRYLTNRMTALKLITVASIFDELVARELGVEKGYALVKYASVTAEADDAPGLFTANAKIAGKHVRDMSYRDLVRATQDEKAKATPRAPSEQEGAAKRAARALQAWLRKSGAKGAYARAQRRNGAWTVTVHVSPDDAVKCVPPST